MIANQVVYEFSIPDDLMREAVDHLRQICDIIALYSETPKSKIRARRELESQMKEWRLRIVGSEGN